MAVDYFTKWVEAEEVAIILGKSIAKFVWNKLYVALVYLIQSSAIMESISWETLLRVGAKRRESSRISLR